MIIIKTADELKRIRLACKVAAEVLDKLKKEVKPGITTLELDSLAEKLLLSRGAVPAFKGYRGYTHSTCISVNFEVVHGIPGGRKLSSGDIVGIDIGAILGGFYGDVAETVAVPPAAKETLNLLKVTKECLYLGVEQARPGKHLGDISHAIERRAKAAGYSVVRDLFGHGIGKSLHEDPLIPNFGSSGKGPELAPGMVLAIEPMVNMGSFEIETLEDGWTVVTRDRALSAHFEHTVAVVSDGPEIMTNLLRCNIGG